MEPYRLRRWKPASEPHRGSIYTCGRPGRSKGKSKQVPDTFVDRWVHGLPPGSIAILSLLGRKNGASGESEFSFYSFTGGLDTPQERATRPTFQEWLSKRHPTKRIHVTEVPTYDGVPIPPDSLATIADCVYSLLLDGDSVVMMDSGGEQRTGQVCKYMNLTEDFSSQ